MNTPEQFVGEYFWPMVEDIELNCSYCGSSFHSWFGYIAQVDEENGKGICNRCLGFTRILVENNWDISIKIFPKGFRRKRDRDRWEKLEHKQKKKYLKELMDLGVALAKPQEELYDYD